jgi:hypothetical protein
VSGHDLSLFSYCSVYEDMFFSCMYAYTRTYRRPFYEKRMSTEMSADFLGDEWKVCGMYMMMHTSEVLVATCYTNFYSIIKQ